jgi:hypothetical protein
MTGQCGMVAFNAALRRRSRASANGHTQRRRRHVFGGTAGPVDKKSIETGHLAVAHGFARA